MTDVHGPSGGTVWLPLRYESLPYQSHPIDVAIGPQGWGPFSGPYTPKDYVTSQQGVGGMSGVSQGYNAEIFYTDHAPGYHDVTVFSDPSLARVNNTLVQAQNDQSPGAYNYSSTIANALTRVKEQGGQSPIAAGASQLFGRLAQALRQQ